MADQVLPCPAFHGELLTSRSIEQLLGVAVGHLAAVSGQRVVLGWRPGCGQAWAAGYWTSAAPLPERMASSAKGADQTTLAEAGGYWLGLGPDQAALACPASPPRRVEDQQSSAVAPPWTLVGRTVAPRPQTSADHDVDCAEPLAASLWHWIATPDDNSYQRPLDEGSAWLPLVLRLAMDLPIRATSGLTPQPRLMAALAEFSAGAGHEINNPLAGILARSRQLLQRETDVAARQSLSAIAHQVYRIRDMIADAVLWASPPTPVLTPIPLARVVDEAVRRMTADRPPGELVGVSVERSDQASGVLVAADALQLTIAIGELVKNAIRAIALGRGQGTLRVEIVARPAEQGVALHVCDDGVGLTELEAGHLFDPFFSGRQAGRGLGFGLCKAWQIVRGHGGILECDRDEHQRTRFTVLLPVVSSGVT